MDTKAYIQEQEQRLKSAAQDIASKHGVAEPGRLKAALEVALGELCEWERRVRPAPREEAAPDAGAVGSGVEPVAWLIRGKDGLRSTTDRSALESWRGYRTITPLVPADAIASLEAQVAALKESLRVAGEEVLEEALNRRPITPTGSFDPEEMEFIKGVMAYTKVLIAMRDERRALASAETGLKQEPDADA